MENRIDFLFKEWHLLGGDVLLREKINLPLSRSPEKVIAESTSFCRDSGRLTWIVLDWLIRNVSKIDEDRLVKETKIQGNLSVLGVLCDLANDRSSHPKFEYILKFCKPFGNQEIFFNRVAKSPLASKLTMQSPIDTFSRWNFICNEVRYLH